MYFHWFYKTHVFECSFRPDKAHARKGKQSRWMTVKRLRPIYRLARRPIINGIIIKAISLNSYMNIKSSVDETYEFLFQGTPRTQVPNRQRQLGIERSNKIFKTDCMWRFGGCILKSASFHKTWRLRPEVRVLDQTRRPRLEVRDLSYVEGPRSLCQIRKSRAASSKGSRAACS